MHIEGAAGEYVARVGEIRARASGVLVAFGAIEGLVRTAGFEPARSCLRGILSLEG